MDVSVILPSYNPSVKLKKTVEALTEAGFDDIIVINDGSNVKEIFEQIKEKKGVTVIDHEQNRGKGRALKTGFEYFLKNRPYKRGVVTADDDLQQSTEDIVACCREMVKCGTAVFGARDFRGKGIPYKSKIGNNITSFTFRFFCGIRITDTQTGLRAIPTEYLPAFIEVSGERFEYETNMLLSMRENGFKFKEIPIKTIYSDNNSATHFRPLVDSIKVYAVILKYIISSLVASIIDLVVFTMLNLLLPDNMEEWLRIFIAVAVARVISSAVNYTVNRKKVFKSRSRLDASLVKYYILTVCQAVLSYGLVYLITSVADTKQSLLQTVYKMVVDIVLFFMCFVLQREWVFKEKKEGK